MSHCRLIHTWSAAKRDGQPVPPVDRNDRERQIHKLFFAELVADLLVQVARHFVVADPGQRFGPGQCCAFTIAVEGCFTPTIENVQSLFGLTGGARSSVIGET